MNGLKDLTRWNRSGLTRFRYVDGKAVEYLEVLRQKLVKKFPQSTGQGNWLNPAEEIPANEEKAKNETLTQRQERLSRKQQRILEMYHQDRRDWAWEITRTFARACHILTEHTNAYANEGYLGTATQWDHVRRLVEMIDYHPAPPASASTRLVFIAKKPKESKTEIGARKIREDKTGIVAKGFQVEYSPPTGGPSVIFETLEDLFIDPALNQLRPRGWDQSDDPAVPSVPLENNGSTQPPDENQQFSSIANGSVINLQGIGKKWANELNTPNINGDFKIKDFLTLVPEETDIDLYPQGLSDEAVVIMLREFKAMATEICNFKLESDWSDISGRVLPEIASEDPESLAEFTGNRVDIVKALQQKIELIGAFLDHEVYKTAILVDLVAPQALVQGAVKTSWRAKQKSNVIPGQVAMVCRELKNEAGEKNIDEAAAVTIASIEKNTGIVHLIPSSVQKDWITNWSKGEARLKVSPRWKRESWLNGVDVIRTVKPHGLSAEAYISWKLDYDLQVTKVDTAGDLVGVGNLLIIIALITGTEQLHIRIFNETGGKVDKLENATSVDDGLVDGDAIDNLKDRVRSLLDGFSLSEDAKQDIIKKAISCAGYTQWRFAKVTEADKRDLRLKVTWPLPQPGAELYELLPIEDSLLPANYEAIVLLGGDDVTPPNVEGVTLDIEDPSNPEPIFCLRNVIVEEMPEEAGGGGLLPPASLPEIGSFLFPSPMLPLDLVKAAVELMLSIGVMVIPSTGDNVFKGMPFGGLLEEAEDDPAIAAQLFFDMLEKLEGVVQEHDPNCEPLWILSAGGSAAYDIENDGDYLRDTDLNLVPVLVSSEIKKLVVWNESLKPDPSTPITSDEEEVIKGALENMLSIPEGKEATILFQRLTEDLVGMLGPILAIPKEPIVKAVVQASDPLYMFNGSSKIGMGDWVVGKFSDGLRALKVASINWFTDSDKTETFSLSFEKLDGDKELKKVYADFRGELIAEGADVNITQLESEEIELEDVPDSLKIDRTVLLTGYGKEPVVAKIESIDGNVVKTSPPPVGCTKGNLIINGNAVLAGHGERMPEKILGSGNAAKSNQEFTLEVEDLSFTPDATKSAGVAAAIEVEVAGRVWEQVSTLKDSVPGDFHYAARMTEDGYVKIHFGDGQYGRRLPTGSNNIRVRYRIGSGLFGNVPVGGLEKPVNPHPLVDAVRQPLSAAGGGDMEDVASLRENAPPTLLALERAVSLTDFSHLAASQSNVWQATAYSQISHRGRTESVKVVIVPTGGVESPVINEATRSFLQQHALPGILVAVNHFVEERFSLSITLRVKTSEFVPEEVKRAVTSALVDHLALKKRKLGKHLYLSEVYKVVENVQGVENSICVLNHNNTLQLIRAANESTVVYLDIDANKNPSMLLVNHEEYQP